MRAAFSFLSASPVFPRATLRLRIAVSGVVCGLLTGAIVFGQDPKAAPAPAQPDLKTAKTILVEAKALKEGAAKARVAAIKGVAIQAAVVNVNLNMNPMIQQFAQQGRPIMRAELLFVRHVCNLTREQLRAISRETDQALNDVAKKMLDIQQQQGIRIRRPGQTNTSADSVNLLQEELALVIKKHLSPEQYQRYRSEFDKRSANRKQAALAFLVDALDHDLVLSREQREKVAEALAEHWDDGWCIYMEYLLSGNQFYPIDLDRYVIPLLNNNQKKVWQGVQRVQGFWGFGNMLGGMINDGDPLLAELGLEEKAVPNPAGVLEKMKTKMIRAPVMKDQMQKVESKKKAVIEK
jgi:hypothetical protein